ncbi:MAG: D-alanine--D-alanine ligase [Proteobacteria bacterium]|nr:D-alanine--D-alanine ligase [Pseudomonadota bacterium]MBU1231305.1 D-alanine--D-alanine ligase [Pseudomonadota bacterium]MBU1417805.1 D-alanine--D-alanine ligase [Pseudomonadota bacterium]MBU1453153.1 D-alanine--D-alanine ligase [Pseudomonadota bacterium]
MEKNRKIRVALLAGGRSGEREVSLAGAAGFEAAIDRERYDIRRYDPKTDLALLARDADSIDVAFILLHGNYGEDGTMQGYLDLLDIPYQGSGVLGSALAMDKNMAKILYRLHGLPVAEWEMARPEDSEDPARLLATLELPLVIKPVREGSSLGMTIAHDEKQLLEGVRLAYDYDSEVMVEQFLAGRELTVGVLGNNELTPLPLVEIIPGEEYAFFDYTAKYKEGATREICPAEVDAAITAKAQALAVTAHRALRLRGYSRTDMILTPEGFLYLLETNTIPGMTPTSLFPQAAAAAGLDFTTLISRLLELALE